MHLFISVWTYFIQWTITGFWRRKWQPTPVFLPEKPHGRRSLVGYSPRGREESDTTERLHFPVSLSCIGEGNGNPLQCSCLQNPRDGGAWRAVVYGVTQSRTRLKRLSSSSSRTWFSFMYSVCPQNCPWFGQWGFLCSLTSPLPTSFFKYFHTIWPKKITQAFILFFLCPSSRISLIPPPRYPGSFQWQKILRISDLGIPYSHC